jgi:hypothetical protein
MPLLRSRAVLLTLAAVITSVAFAPFAFAGESDHPKLDVGVGWSFLHINDVEFSAVTDFFITEVIDRQTDHNGELNGYKLTAELTGLMPHRRGDWLATLGVNGFYSRYEDTQDTRCTFTADSDCVFVPIVDPSPAIIDSSGLFSDWFTSTERSVTYWGAAIELSLARSDAAEVGMKDGGSLKDPPAPAAAPLPFIWKVGVGARRLDQRTDLFSEDFGPTLDPVTLTDELDTNYFGGYLGFATVAPIGNGAFRLRLSGESGLYYADTQYNGAYTATANLGADQPVAESIELNDSRAAFIGTLNLALERDVGAATVALFGEAEWLSYAPKVLYNDVDRAGGFPFDISGSQDGTELGGGSALTYTLGARVSVPLQ